MCNTLTLFSALSGLNRKLKLGGAAQAGNGEAYWIFVLTLKLDALLPNLLFEPVPFHIPVFSFSRTEIPIAFSSLTALYCLPPLSHSCFLFCCSFWLKGFTARQKQKVEIGQDNSRFAEAYASLPSYGEYFWNMRATHIDKGNSRLHQLS